MDLPSDGKEVRSQLFATKEAFGGEYVLFAEYSYRRKSDFVKQTDTTYFYYDATFRFYEEVRLQIGAGHVIDRLKKYLHDGPELSINVKRDRYEVYRHVFGACPTTVRTVPRKTEKDK